MTYGIVISSYKYGHLAAHCIETVLSQNTQFDKIWFVDDGAGDCKHLEYLYQDSGIEFILRDRNLGIVDNFNDMLNRVDTDYVMFLGADNWLRADAQTLLNWHIEAFKPKVLVYDIVVTGILKMEIAITYPTQNSSYLGDLYWDRKGFHHGSMMYHAETARELGGYADNKGSSRTDEDQNLWDKFKRAGHTCHHLDSPLLYYRRHKENFNKY